MSAAILAMEFGLVLQIMIVAVYWPLIHSDVILSIAEGEVIAYWITILIHSWPFFAVTLNVLVSQVVFIYCHYRYMILVGIVYALTNYSATKLKGKPLYKFLHWEDQTSIIISLSLLSATVFFFLALSFAINTNK